MTFKAQSIIKPLLKWYDRHRRDLPWRARPGALVDPYRVWLSEIMLQQTTVPAVGPYFAKFLKHYPKIQDLARAPVEDVMRDWAGLGYYSRARNLHACAKIVSETMGGHFPKTLAALKMLPGIGDYTAGAIAAIAFGQQATVVDGNVERVVARLFEAKNKNEIRQHAQNIYHDKANTRPADLPQAFMDHGATICTPKKPRCAICPVSGACDAFAHGTQELYPIKVKDKNRPERKGFVYWVTDSKGRVLLHRRPTKGLLGGMAGLPTSEWSDEPKHLKNFKIRKIEKETVRHVFTHFGLTLTIAHASVKSLPKDHYWIEVSQLQVAGLPTVFNKVIKLIS